MNVIRVSSSLLKFLALVLCVIGVSACSTLPPTTTARQLGSLRYGMPSADVRRVAGSEGLRDRYFRTGGTDYSVHQFRVAGRDYSALALYGEDRLQALLHVSDGESLWRNNRERPFAQWLGTYVQAMRAQRLPLDERVIRERLGGHPETQIPLVIALPLLAIALPIAAVRAPFDIAEDKKFQSGWRRLRLGMSKGEVESLLGRPNTVRSVKGSSDELWQYPWSHTVGIGGGRLILVTDYYYWD